MDIQFKALNDDIVSINSSNMKFKTGGKIKSYQLNQIKSVEILDCDELVVRFDDDYNYSCLFPDDQLKNILKFYENINGDKYYHEKLDYKLNYKKNKTMNMIFSILLIVSSAALVAAFIKNEYIYMILSMIIFIISLSKTKAKSTKNNTNSFSIFEEFMLTGNGTVLFFLVAFGFISLVLIFLSLFS